MTDSQLPTPPHGGSQGPGHGAARTEPPDYIGRSITGMLGRTGRSLSPWVRRMWQPAAVSQPGETPDASARQPSASASFGALARTRPLGASPALTLAHRVQRKSAHPGLLQPAAGPRTAAAVSHMAETVVRRFPAIASRFEMRPLDVSGAVQRSELPFSDTASASDTLPALEPLESDSPAMSAGDSGADYAPITVSPEESIAAQMTARLEAFRQSDWNASQSPRQISRKASEVAAARSAKPAAERPGQWRSRVEEIGVRREPTTPAEEPAPASPKPVERITKPSEAVQRKSAESPSPERAAPEQADSHAPPASVPPPAVPPPHPVKPPSAGPKAGSPVVQRKTLPVQSEDSDVESAGPRPDLPSISRLLAERFDAARTEWRAETVDGQPAFLSEAPEPSSPEPAVRRSPRRSIQRQAAPPTQAVRGEPARAEKVEPAPPPVEPDERAEAAPPASVSAIEELPLVQRSAAPVNPPAVADPASRPQPEPAAPSNEPEMPAPSAAPPTVQRKAVPATAPAQLPTQARPEPPPAHPEPSRPPAPIDSALPLREPPRPPASILPQDGGAERPVAATVSTSEPAIQRSVDALPLQSPPPPAAPSAGPTSQPPAGPAAELTASPAPLEPSSQTSPQIQRRAQARAEPEAPQALDAPEGEAQGPTPLESAVDRPPPLPRAAPKPMARAQPADMPVLSKARIQPRREGQSDSELPLEAPRAMQPRTPDQPAETMAVAGRPMAVVQRSTETAAPPHAERPKPSLPLAPAVSRAAERIQREETSTASTVGESTGVDTQPEGPPAPSINLHELARRIYPILKRMLAIERERR